MLLGKRLPLIGRRIRKNTLAGRPGIRRPQEVLLGFDFDLDQIVILVDHQLQNPRQVFPLLVANQRGCGQRNPLAPLLTRLLVKVRFVGDQSEPDSTQDQAGTNAHECDGKTKRRDISLEQGSDSGFVR